MSGLLRICTAGSVDDGKSTLIGRLLHDSQSVYEDQVHSVQVASKNRGVGLIDYSLFTDGLKAEREQGITIDVAYRYFATARRKFILADTPGHEQYTRNMATGASTADVAILLVDARQGVRVQSRRHARIARLLGITDFVLAINKMDLVDFDRDVFEGIRDEFEEILRGARFHAIPLSALQGDNVITTSARTPWFEGPSLLEFLETVRGHAQHAGAALPLPRAAGGRGRTTSSAATRGRLRRARCASATRCMRGRRAARRGSGASSPTTATWTWRIAPMSVTLTLDDEIDISRGDMITTEPPMVGQRFEAEMVWMDERPLDPARVYLLKHASKTVTAEINHGLAAEPDWHGDRLDRAAAGVRPLRRQPRHRQLHRHRPGHAFHGGGGDDRQRRARRRRDGRAPRR